MKEIDNALEKLDQIRGVTFNWKDGTQEKELDDTEQVGVIAQEVAKVYPQLVDGEEGNMRVNYPGLVAPLIEAVKELKAITEAQSAEIEVLKAKLADK